VSRKIGDPPSCWEAQLPAELLRLPEELARMDTLLDDPAFFAVKVRVHVVRRSVGVHDQLKQSRIGSRPGASSASSAAALLLPLARRLARQGHPRIADPRA
jgi:hypothetical protein